MTSKTVTQFLAELKIDQSHSRPRVSNDNPYSEANFKTLKYCPAFPNRFGSIQHARSSAKLSSNTIIISIGIPGSACTRPTSVHFGTAEEIREQRAQVLQAAYATHPERFHRKPVPPALPAKAWINEPQPSTIETTEGPQQANNAA